MAIDVLAGLSIFKTLFDSAKGLKDINDAAIRNAAVVDLQKEILAAQAEQMALLERVSELEAKVASFEAWDCEKLRYQLTDHGGGTFTYALKAGKEEGEPFHRICPHCYEERRKSILQSRGLFQGREKVVCLSCESEFMLGVIQPQRQTHARGRDFNPF